MTFEIYLPDDIPQDKVVTKYFKDFLQKMANRIAVGACRYASTPTVAGKYKSRMEVEVKAYAKTGNAEHLYNIANYAFLESVAPENIKFNQDPLAESATRKKFGLAKNGR